MVTRRQHAIHQVTAQAKLLVAPTAQLPVHPAQGKAYFIFPTGIGHPRSTMQPGNAGYIASHRGWCLALRHGIDEGDDCLRPCWQHISSFQEAPFGEYFQVGVSRPLGVGSKGTP